MADPPPRPMSALRRFLKSEAAGGIVLMAAAALALIVANSPLAEAYQHLLHLETGPVLSPKLGPMTVHLWINDGLMAVFFLLVGLEIKREFVDGRLSTWDRRRLPVIAAAVGMAVPALIYLAVAGGEPGLGRGWAIPAATDIAFAIGVLALLGSRAPTSLKLFLTTVAIVDDLGAVAIIALAYTASLDTLALGAAAVDPARHAARWARAASRALWPYLIGAAAALVRGAAVGRPRDRRRRARRRRRSRSSRRRARRTRRTRRCTGSSTALAPWVAFLIVPLFGFANAGVPLDGVGLERLLAPLPLGDRRRPVPRQAGRHLRRGLAGRPARPRRAACAARPGCRSTAWRCCAASASR